MAALGTKVDDIPGARLWLPKERIMTPINRILRDIGSQLSGTGNTHLLTLDGGHGVSLRLEIGAWHIEIPSVSQWRLVHNPGLWSQQRYPMILLGRGQVVKEIILRVGDDVQA